MYSDVNQEYPVKLGVQYSTIVSSFSLGQEGIKKDTFKQYQRSLTEFRSYSAQAKNS